jgi:hypothetical protein
VDTQFNEWEQDMTTGKLYSGRTTYNGNDIDRGDDEIGYSNTDDLMRRCNETAKTENTDAMFSVLGQYAKALEKIRTEPYAPEIHTADSFHADAGDIILSDDITDNNELRHEITRAIKHLDNQKEGYMSTAFEAKRAAWIAQHLMTIGQMVVTNTINNGYTAEQLGWEKE